MSTKLEKKNLKQLHMMISVFIMVAFRFLPPFGQMTEPGMQVLGVFVGGLYGWIFVDLLWPSLIGLLVLGTTDAITMDQLFINGFGNQIVVMTAGMLFLTAYITQCNLSDVIVSWMMTRKIALGRPYMCLFCFMMAAYFVSIISNSLIAVVLFMPLYRSLAEQLGIPAYHKMQSVYICGMAVAACIAEVCLPFKAMVLMVMGSFSASYGIAVDYGTLTFFTFPATIFLVVCYVLFCKYILRIDARDFVLTNVEQFKLKAEVNKKTILGLFFIAIILLALLLPNFLPAEMFLAVFLKKLGYGGIVFLVLGIMMFVRIDGESLLNLPSLAKDFNWGVYILMAYFMPISSLLTSDITGVKPTLSTMFEPVLSVLSPYMFVIVVIALAAILTNFLNNTIIAVLFASLVTVLGGSLSGINIYVVVILVMIAANFSVATPAANPVNAFLFSQVDLIKFKDHLLHSCICCAFLIFVTVTLLWMLGNIMF